jgi:dTDP-4-amino-4,6-dideoxy-D-galactose acyltransferase
VSYERLPWDSEFFGFEVGRVVAAAGLAAAVADADADGIRCLYLLSPAEDDSGLAAALDLGFRPYDVRIELARSLEDAPAAPTGIREATEADRDPLDAIARGRLRGTRFWNDPHFDRERVADLYSAWLRRGLTTPLHRRTLTVDGVAGFVTCGFDRDRRVGTIELIAVAEDAAGQGLGARLLAAADAAFAAAGCEVAEVVTQARNIAAQRLYQAAGYRTREAGTWLHRWRLSGDDSQTT